MSSNLQFPSKHLAKLIFFCFFQLITCFIYVGILPTILLFITYFLMRRDRSIHLFLKAIKLVVAYVFLVVIFGLYVNACNYETLIEQLPLSSQFIGMGIGYLIIMKFFLVKPIKAYGQHLEMLKVNSQSTLNVLNSENDTQYSVADELLKWKALKDSGLISEKDFHQMKDKIMKN